MSLANGRDHLAIPGPSVLPSRVLQAMHRPAPNIYGGELIEMTETVYRDLAKLAGSRREPVIYIGNGHAAWEASLVNVLSRGDRLLGLASGHFGLSWARMASALGAEVETLHFGTRSGVDMARVEQALQDDTSHGIKAVTTVITDTASGLRTDIPALRAVLDRTGHPALLMVDAICSFACEPFQMDEWGVDVMVTASQKGLMTPPGIALVYANERAISAGHDADMVTPYWNWTTRIDYALFWARFCGTAPTHHLYGLREALDMLLEEGIDTVWARHQALAEVVWACVDRWRDHPDSKIACHVTDRQNRSHAVTPIETAAGDSIRIREWCEREAGVTLGVGFAVDDRTDDAIFRIGHMGHLNAPMLLGTLACINTALVALNIPHGSGAMDAASNAVAALVRKDTLTTSPG